MANHLSHSVPWNALHDALHIDAQASADSSCVSYRFAIDRDTGFKVMRHFADVFAAQIAQFAATDKSTPEQKQPYDATKWDNGMLRGSQGHLGVQTSLLCGYIALNLLLLDSKKYRRSNLIDPDTNWALQNCRGQNDGGHPEWIAAKFHRLFTADTPLLQPDDGKVRSWKSFTHVIDAEATALMQEQCKHYFRALYTLAGLGHETSSDHIFNAACWFFGLSPPIAS